MADLGICHYLWLTCTILQRILTNGKHRSSTYKRWFNGDLFPTQLLLHSAQAGALRLRRRLLSSPQYTESS